MTLMSTTGRPKTWVEAQERLADVLGGPSCAADVEAWLRECVKARWDVESLHDLDRERRSVAFQKLSGVVLALEDYPGDLAFVPEHREVVRRTFARYFNGVCLDGPAWRLSPFEDDRPARMTSEFNDDDLEV